MRFLLQYSVLFLAAQAANVQKIIVKEAFNKAVAQYKEASAALEEQLCKNMTLRPTPSSP